MLELKTAPGQDPVKRIGRRVLVAAAACLLGTALWIGLSTRGGSPLDSGGRLLASLLAAGFAVALIEGELSWTGLFGLFLGQIGAIYGQAFYREPGPDAYPLTLEMLFLLSYNLAAAIGGAAGALLRSARGVSLRGEKRTWESPATGSAAWL